MGYKMRIALDARYINGKGSGIGSYTLNLARALLDEDPSLRLLLIRSFGGSRPLLDNPRVAELLFPFPAISPATQLLLGPFLRGQRFDLFHSPFDLSPRPIDKPLVVTIHDINWIVNPRYNSNSPLFRLLAGAYYRMSLNSSMANATRLLAVSHATRHAIEEYTPWHAAKVHVTCNGIDRNAISPLSRKAASAAILHLVAPGTPFVLTVGSASPNKNHLNAVRGFLAAFGHRPEYRMILVRRFLRRDQEMNALLASPRASAQVIALQHVSAATLNALYNAARIFLHPSYYEGFGIPLLEAMAARIPIVTSRLSSMPEVVGPAALLVDPADPLCIAEALTTLDHDDALREHLISEGDRRLELFSWSRCAKATLEVYRQLV
jgi:glycosyltransferase involved in cell wall biosynthesis